jgi:hypothetical protein
MPAGSVQASALDVAVLGSADCAQLVGAAHRALARKHIHTLRVQAVQTGVMALPPL